MEKIVLLDMPTSVCSFVKHGVDCDTIVINAKLSQEKQQECYIHEKEHLNDDDFSCTDADLTEYLAHGGCGR